MINQWTTYEQPLNELTRASLRIEHALQQARHYIHQTSVWDHRAAMVSMVDTLNILDRPDLKAKLVTELKRYQETFEKWANSPHLDHSKLNTVAAKIETLLNRLHHLAGRFGQSLRENAFFEHVRQHLSNGGYQFDAPAFHCWLNQSAEQRKSQLNAWYQEFELIETTTHLLLSLTRQSGQPKKIHVEAGYYEQSLDPNAPWQLLQVAVPTEMLAFPEISAGRHRLCIRFLTPNFPEKGQQISNNFACQLTCCVI